MVVIGTVLLLLGLALPVLPARYVRVEQRHYGVMTGARGGRILVRTILVLIGVTLAVSGAVLLSRGL